MYSREQPSERYLELIEQYQQLHVEGEKSMGLAPENTFPGQSLIPQAPDIKRIIQKVNAKTILDYGSGKGLQYEPRPIVVKDSDLKFESIPHFWGVDSVTCYDPCYVPFSNLPNEKFDGVVCTDVLEHCPEEDIDWVVDGLFSFATKFVYANIACYPAKKTLPNGENAHCTIKSSNWWLEKIKAISSNHPDIVFEFWMDVKTQTEGGERLDRQRISNFNY